MKIDPDLTLAGALQALQKGSFSPALLLDRLCTELEKKEPEIQAFLPEPGRRKRLHSDLKKLFLKYPDPSSRPPLFGIPVGVKDLYQVNGFPTRAGSQLPPQVFHGKEAFAVTRLKAAGALILGKTVTTEFAYFEPGPTRNPLNPAHTPGGSSSGSAAAVAAGYCPLSLGTQTIGSVIRPAAYCGIIGFKPSQGRMPTDGIIPFSTTIDQAGFFVNDLESLSIAANILVDNWQEQQNDNQQQITLAIPEGKYLEQCEPDIIAAFQQDIAVLVEKGIRIKTIPLWENIKELNRLHRELIAKEFSEVHQPWFRRYSKLYSLRSTELIEKGKQITETTVSAALALRKTVQNRIRQVMEANAIDAFISPATSTFAPLGLDSTGSPVMNLPWTFAGVPAISIPGAVNQQGLISGLQLTASLQEDEKLIKIVKIIKKIRQFENKNK